MSRQIDAVVVGGSAGAVEALRALLAELSPGFRLPLAVVIHLPRNRPSPLVTALAGTTDLIICEAEDKLPFIAGTVHVAPPDYHLLIEDGATLALSTDEPVNFSLPSIDVLFESAATVYGARVAGVILSGANDDGAAGLRAICDAGGVGVVQGLAEASSATMPRAARARCPEARELPLAEIARTLRRLDAAPVT